MKKDSYKIIGGNKLNGEVWVQSSKNATLPLISASILTNENVVINNYPRITDIFNMLKILKKMNVKVNVGKHNIKIISKKAKNKRIDCLMAGKMRSSIFFLGALLARFKKCSLAQPGGCKIGSRPIDIHIQALKKLNVKVIQDCNYMHFDASKAKSNTIKFKLPSVGATENIVQFASLLPGTTIIKNAAKEPEVVELCNFLNKMGADIQGAGSNIITINGVSKLAGIQHQPSGDRIVTGTLMLAVAICGGNVSIKNAKIEENINLIDKLRLIGCKIQTDCGIINISSKGDLINLESINTGYYPDFPTDMQSLMLVACCVGKGKTTITENLFENRFLTVDELIKMGAKITKVNSHTVEVEGSNLVGSTVYAQDLRGGASLVLAGMKAEGKTIVNNVHFINRGYQRLDKVLNSLGANIKRV